MNAPAHHPPAIRTTCPYCGVGCGVLAKPDGPGGAVIAADPNHPANLGRLCSKGSALGETLALEGRLLHPMRRQGDGTLARIAWGTALKSVATGFHQVIARDGPGAVAFYLSGQLLTEDYYVANKLMKGFIGSANVDTNSRLCMASSARSAPTPCLAYMKISTRPICWSWSARMPHGAIPFCTSACSPTSSGAARALS